MKDINRHNFWEWIIGLFLVLLAGGVHAFTKSALYPLQPKLEVRVSVKGIKSTDTVYLGIISKFYPIITYDTLYVATNQKDSTLVFSIPSADTCGYFSLAVTEKGEKKLKALTEPYFWETGDELTADIVFKPTASGVYSPIKFSGADKFKYQVFHEIFYGRDIFKNEESKVDGPFYKQDEWLIKARLDLLNKNKAGLSALNSGIIRSMIQYDNISRLRVQTESYLKNIDVSERKKFLENEYPHFFSTLDSCGFSDQVLLNTLGLLDKEYKRLETESLAENGKVDPKWMYGEIEKESSTVLRDRLWTYSFLKGKYDKEADHLFRLASAKITDKESKFQMAKLEPLYGLKLLKDYFLSDVNGNKILITEKNRGKAMLIDVWATGCGACAVFYQNVLKRILKEYEPDKNIVFISLSLDKDRDRWLQSIRRDLYTSADELNLYTSGNGAYDPFVVNNVIGHTPTVILLDKNGLIRYFDTENLFTYEGLKSALKEVL